MIILGWISIVVGIILSVGGVIGYNEADTEYYGFAKYADSNNIETARVVILIGAIIFILGVVFLIIGYMNRNREDYIDRKDKLDMMNTRMCLKCRNICDFSQVFCSVCGNNLEEQARRLHEQGGSDKKQKR